MGFWKDKSDKTKLVQAAPEKSPTPPPLPSPVSTSPVRKKERSHVRFRDRNGLEHVVPKATLCLRPNNTVHSTEATGKYYTVSLEEWTRLANMLAGKP